MDQFKLDLLWFLNKTAISHALPVLGVGCTGTSEEETITTLGGIWARPAGTRIWQEMKPFTGNLPTG